MRHMHTLYITQTKLFPLGILKSEILIFLFILPIQLHTTTEPVEIIKPKKLDTFQNNRMTLAINNNIFLSHLSPPLIKSPSKYRRHFSHHQL